MNRKNVFLFVAMVCSLSFINNAALADTPVIVSRANLFSNQVVNTSAVTSSAYTIPIDEGPSAIVCDVNVADAISSTGLTLTALWTLPAGNASGLPSRKIDSANRQVWSSADSEHGDDFLVSFTPFPGATSFQLLAEASNVGGSELHITANAAGVR